MINAVNELALIAPKDVTGLANELTVAMLSYNTATLRGGAPPENTVSSGELQDRLHHAMRPDLGEPV
jgi:hypothetical protein